MNFHSSIICNIPKPQTGAPGWLSQLSLRLLILACSGHDLRSCDPAGCGALCWVGSLLEILSLPVLAYNCRCAPSLSLKKKKLQTIQMSISQQMDHQNVAQLYQDRITSMCPHTHQRPKHMLMLPDRNSFELRFGCSPLENQHSRDK